MTTHGRFLKHAAHFQYALFSSHIICVITDAKKAADLDMSALAPCAAVQTGSCRGAAAVSADRICGL